MHRDVFIDCYMLFTPSYSKRRFRATLLSPKVIVLVGPHVYEYMKFFPQVVKYNLTGIPYHYIIAVVNLTHDFVD